MLTEFFVTNEELFYPSYAVQVTVTHSFPILSALKPKSSIANVFSSYQASEYFPANNS